MVENNTTPRPVSVVILGATGDLAQRKLFPALVDLFADGSLPEQFQVVGFARSERTDNKFREFIEKAVNKKEHSHPGDLVQQFLEHCFYTTGFFEDAKAYEALAQRLFGLDKKNFDDCSDKLFYLAVPPPMYENIFRNLASSGLTIPCGGDRGWTRVLVEKPFGRDTATAQKLDVLLGELFREEQIFRIDHYLTREAVQNILAFRFSNTLFEPVWDRGKIERVEITFLEVLGMEGRGVFYDDIGALRDVGQNHMLEMLALVAMEDPKALDAAAIRRERASVLGALAVVGEGNVAEQVVRGQYQGYRDEKGVKPDSQTATYFRIKAFIDSERWRGVPFYLESGKRLHESKTEITMHFKETQSCVCPPGDDHAHQNKLTFRVKPEEEIEVLFWAKKPGLAYELEARELSFSYAASPTGGRAPEAYEKVLYDCIRGDQTLFASTDEVMASWRFITPILEYWTATPLHPYEPGSRGPAAARRLQ